MHRVYNIASIIPNRVYNSILFNKYYGGDQQVSIVSYGVPSVSKILPNGLFVYLFCIYKYDSYLSKYLSYLYTSARYNILDLGI